MFCRGSCPTVAAGDLVQVSGEVDEFFGMTQVSATTGIGGRITRLSSGNALPGRRARSPCRPAGSTRAEATFEPVEGMVVTFPGTLVVSEYFELARFGQLVLTADERPFQFTHDNLPSVEWLRRLPRRPGEAPDHPRRRQQRPERRRQQRRPTRPYPYPSPGLSVDNRSAAATRSRPDRCAALVVRRAGRHRRVADPADPGRGLHVRAGQPRPGATRRPRWRPEDRRLQRPQLLHDDRHDAPATAARAVRR